MQAKIINKTGHGISDKVYFETTFAKLPDYPTLYRIIEDMQEELGYHPTGYGYPVGVYTEVLTNGSYKVTWHCAASCD